MVIKKGSKQTKEHIRKYLESPEYKNKVIEAIKEGHKTNPNYGMKGKHHSKETKIQISESNKGKNKGHTHTEEVKKKQRKLRATQIFPIQNSFIEIKIQNFLSLLHIEYITHKYISEITHAYQCDIYIPSKKLIIETDGCYWHGCLICNKNNKGLNELQNKQIQEDEIRTKELEEKGFRVIRLRECDIKKMELNQFKETLIGNNKKWI